MFYIYLYLVRSCGETILRFYILLINNSDPRNCYKSYLRKRQSITMYKILRQCRFTILYIFFLISVFLHDQSKALLSILKYRNFINKNLDYI